MYWNKCQNELGPCGSMRKFGWNDAKELQCLTYKKKKVAIYNESRRQIYDDDETNQSLCTQNLQQLIVVWSQPEYYYYHKISIMLNIIKITIKRLTLNKCMNCNN